MSKKKHKKKHKKMNHKHAKTSFVVDCSLYEGAEGSWFEDWVKANIDRIMEIDKDGYPIEISHHHHPPPPQYLAVGSVHQSLLL